MCAAVLTIAGLNSNAAIKPMKNESFPFELGQTILTKQLAHFTDSVYAGLIPGESLKLILISKEEENLESVKRAQLTFKRAEAILLHCYKSGYSNKDFYAEMVPYTTPHTVRSNDLSTGPYRSFMSKNALTYFVFSLKDVALTAKSSLTFDANTKDVAQDFTFYPKEVINANLASGTQIVIPASSLMFADGTEPNGQVNITVAEYTALDAMIFKAMTTSSNGHALQTGGMWNITAESDGKPLQMKAGMNYDIMVAKPNETKNMKVFTGKMKNGVLDWVEQKDGSVTASKITTNGGLNSQQPVSEIGINNDDAVNELAVDNLNLNNRNLNQLNVNNINSNINVSTKNQFRGRNKKAWTKEETEEMIKEEKEYQKDIYDMKLNDFGWINCDAFDPETQKLTDVYVHGDITEKSNVMLVFGKRKSVLPGYLCADGKSVKFTNVAADETAMVIVFERTGNGDQIKKFTKLITPERQKNISVKTINSTTADLGREIQSSFADLN
jgi:hypothetical protein